MIKGRKTAARYLALVTQLGITVMAPIFLCIFIGYFLDSRYGFRSLIILLPAGFAAGGRNGWLLVKRMLAESEQEESKEDGDRGENTHG